MFDFYSLWLFFSWSFRFTWHVWIAFYHICMQHARNKKMSRQVFVFSFLTRRDVADRQKTLSVFMGNATDIHQRRPRRNRVSAGTALTVRCCEINGHCEVNLGPGTVMERIRLTEGRKTCSLMRLRQFWLCTLPQCSSKSSRRTKIFIIDLTAALPNEVPSAYLLFNFYETEGPHIAGGLPRWH